MVLRGPRADRPPAAAGRRGDRHLGRAEACAAASVRPRTGRRLADPRPAGRRGGDRRAGREDRCGPRRRCSRASPSFRRGATSTRASPRRSAPPRPGIAVGDRGAAGNRGPDGRNRAPAAAGARRVGDRRPDGRACHDQGPTGGLGQCDRPALPGRHRQDRRLSRRARGPAGGNGVGAGQCQRIVGAGRRGRGERRPADRGGADQGRGDPDRCRHQARRRGGRCGSRPDPRRARRWPALRGPLSRIAAQPDVDRPRRIERRRAERRGDAGDAARQLSGRRPRGDPGEHPGGRGRRGLRALAGLSRGAGGQPLADAAGGGGNRRGALADGGALAPGRSRRRAGRSPTSCRARPSAAMGGWLAAARMRAEAVDGLAELDSALSATN